MIFIKDLICSGGIVMDNSIKEKCNIAFGTTLLLIVSAVFIWLSSIYFFDFLNKKDIIKVHFSMFFILCVPLLLYFSFGGFMILMNKESILRKYRCFKKILYLLLGVAVLSFVFLIIGQKYMDSELISRGYTKCPKSSFRSSTIYVIDAELCRK